MDFKFDYYLNILLLVVWVIELFKIFIFFDEGY
jgi:hypothetical protein